MPRIISGSARGTRLAAPHGDATRPTGDKVKEALFSIIAARLPATGFLDIYAGTGQIGLEAASRGCDGVVLIEKAPASLAVIRTNIEKTRLAGKVSVMPMDAKAALKKLSTQEKYFPLIFLDPPYKDALASLTGLAQQLSQLLSPNGLMILEHDSREQPPAFVTNLQLSRSCQYGTAMLSFYIVQNTENLQNG